MTKQIFRFSAYTAQQDGVTQEHTGTLEGARRKAVAYAKEVFPKWIPGYGPTIVVADATGQRVIEQRL